MNKILLVAAALLFGSATFAQTTTATQTPSQNEGEQKGGRRGQRGGGSPEKRAKKQTAFLVKELGLNATQESKTYEAILNAVNSRMAARNAYPDDKAAMREKAKSIQNDLDSQFKNIFTPEQYTAYTTKKAEMKGKMKARRAEKQDDTPFDLD
jgi:Spy/CpxP family protein refolding chaperone